MSLYFSVVLYPNLARKVVFEDHLLSTKPFDIVCYGIGSVQKSKNAQYQFVLALILRDLLKVGICV